MKLYVKIKIRIVHGRLQSILLKRFTKAKKTSDIQSQRDTGFKRKKYEKEPS